MNSITDILDLKWELKHGAKQEIEQTGKIGELSYFDFCCAGWLSLQLINVHCTQLYNSVQYKIERNGPDQPDNLDMGTEYKRPKYVGKIYFQLM